MSAKWRRKKKRSRWSNFSRDLNESKDEKSPQALRNKNSRIKRRIHPYKYRLPRTYRGRTCKELEPLIDVLEEKEDIVVVAGFPGLKRKSLKIFLKDQQLSLSAEALDRKYHKSLNLPKRVVPDTTRTKYKNGVLEIRLKKDLREKTIDKVAG